MSWKSSTLRVLIGQWVEIPFLWQRMASRLKSSEAVSARRWSRFSRMQEISSHMALLFLRELLLPHAFQLQMPSIWRHRSLKTTSKRESPRAREVRMVLRSAEQSKEIVSTALRFAFHHMALTLPLSYRSTLNYNSAQSSSGQVQEWHSKSRRGSVWEHITIEWKGLAAEQQNDGHAIVPIRL